MTSEADSTEETDLLRQLAQLLCQLAAHVVELPKSLKHKPANQFERHLTRK